MSYLNKYLLQSLPNIQESTSREYGEYFNLFGNLDSCKYYGGMSFKSAFTYYVSFSWRHTSIVAFGEEFFFGGVGISSCPPVREWTRNTSSLEKFLKGEMSDMLEILHMRYDCNPA